ncbi:MAG: hypothetical protein K0R28_3191 [Paenibacillus sp.]|jgi:catechol 2,3-dioxygenase-like lactoylglutathione lyase family enzyme|nr:hypothetical protein [Paenibacillus sp.]
MDGQLIDDLDHVQIPVTDLEQSIEWYKRNLGFELHGRPEHDEMAFIWLGKAPLFLLWKTEDVSKAHFRKGRQQMPIFCFRTRDIELLKRHLLHQGVEIISFTDEGFGFCMDFYDNSGNLLNATQYK